MEPLAGIDAAFLYMETRAAHMHVLGAIILEPAPESEPGYTFARLERVMRRRLHRVPHLRRRMMRDPLGVGHPVWVDDARFRLAAHLHRSAVPSPGGTGELTDMIGHLAAIPLDRDRPLWEIWAVEGLEGGRAALVCKFHHAMIDGVSGAGLMQHLLDLAPEDADRDPPPPRWRPERSPSQLELGLTAARDLAFHPFRLAKVGVRATTSLAEMGWSVLGSRSDRTAPAVPGNAPPTMVNRAISSDRCVALGCARLQDLKEIKKAFDLKLNDVILAACSLALREYLEEHDDLPGEPLTAAIPVSVRQDGDRQGTGNAVSAMFVRLPVHLEQPRDHLDFVRHESARAKEVHGSSPRPLIPELAELSSPTWFSALIDLYSSFDLASSHAPLYNLVVSNIPGPPAPLYCVGSRVEACYPLGPIFEGAAMNVTVMSYVDTVGIGVLACPDVVPRVEAVTRNFEKAIRRLHGCAAPRKRGGAKRRARKRAEKGARRAS